MKKIKKWLAKNELSRGKLQADKAKKAGGVEADSSFESAYKKFASAALLDAENAEIFHHWGLTVYDQASGKQGKEAKELYKTACEKFEAALKLDPDNAKVMNDWGAALMEQARNKATAKRSDPLYQEAQEKILAADKLEPGLGAYNLACLHSLRNEPAECKRRLEQARESGNLPEKRYIETDNDLDNVRGKEWFQAFVTALSEEASVQPETKAETQTETGEEAAETKTDKSQKTKPRSWWRRLIRSS